MKHTCDFCGLGYLTLGPRAKFEILLLFCLFFSSSVVRMVVTWLRFSQLKRRGVSGGFWTVDIIRLTGWAWQTWPMRGGLSGSFLTSHSSAKKMIPGSIGFLDNQVFRSLDAGSLSSTYSPIYDYDKWQTKSAKFLPALCNEDAIIKTIPATPHNVY